MAQFSRMAKDAETHFDFASVGSMSRDYQGSRRKKGGSKRSSKKSGGRKKESREEVGFIAGGVPPGEELQVRMHVWFHWICTLTCTLTFWVFPSYAERVR